MVQILPKAKGSVFQQLLGGAIEAAPEALGALTKQIEYDKLLSSRENYYVNQLGLSKEDAAGLARMPESVQVKTIEGYRKGPEEAEKAIREKRESEILAKRASGENLTKEELAELSPTSLRSIAQQEKPVFEQESEKLAAKRASEQADTIEKDYETYQSEKFRLDTQEALAKKGNLSAPITVKMMDMMGLPISVLGNPDNEQYEKVTADYVRDVSKIFPGQIRVFEIESYLKTVPTLLNSDEGKLKVIENRRITNKAKELKYNAYKEIMKGRTVPPANLNMLINEKIGDELRQLQTNYIENIRESIKKNTAPIRMKDPKTGKIRPIPSYALEQAIEEGYTFADQKDK